ncbi:MAG: heme ABC transporter ATP-binding protein [Halobacteriota archaeon]|uniref:heme ABC transporter ATP-binding protein n=1 Tax=Natronomonas sp. TaxID=2184060 RepID=UPI0039768720
MIEFDGVGVDFGDVTVLDDVDLPVGSGEFLALVGPNGAGKTTLLGTCNGLLLPDRGVVRVDDRNVADCSAREIGRLVATVSQETSVAFEFDVADIVAMGRTPHRSRFEPADDADRAAVEAALEQTDTARFADRSIEELSGGERQRVIVARALAQETPVLLLDEPTASLDINHQIRTLSLARTLANDGRTVVAAIHDLELAARFCDRIALLSDGTILAEGSPETVLTSERLESAFGVRTAVSTNPITGTHAVTPLSDEPPNGMCVHVLGSGESAARTIGRLVDAGISVTVGVLPEGDVAAVTARGLAREVVTAPAFEPISADRLATAESLVTAADATIVAGPIDGSNERLARTSEPLFVLEGVSNPPAEAHVIAEHDFHQRIELLSPDPTPPQ